MKEDRSDWEEVVVCPYCMEFNQLDPPIGCCGEGHAQKAWLKPDGEIVLDYDLEK